MKRLILLAIVGVVLGGCATQPERTVEEHAYKICRDRQLSQVTIKENYDQYVGRRVIELRPLSPHLTFDFKAALGNGIATRADFERYHWKPGQFATCVFKEKERIEYYADHSNFRGTEGGPTLCAPIGRGWVSC